MIEISLSGIQAEPQGSGRAMMIGGKARYIQTSSNKQGKRMMAYRKALAQEAARVVALSGKTQPYFTKHVPVYLEATFFFKRPPSVPKSRQYPVVPPDRDKLLRSTQDALTGILYHDDAQVIDGSPRKLYASFDGVLIVARSLESKSHTKGDRGESPEHAVGAGS